MRKLLAALALGLAWTAAAAAEGLPPGEARVSQLWAHALPALPGKSLKGVLVEYGPGAGSPPHTHASSAFIAATVLDGAIRSQVNDGPARVYRAGEGFTEMPGDHHAVSENASGTAPARLLAVFVVDTAQEVLTIPDRR
ncbi:cupin domain-containing protein [Dankookia rubra]|uniref:Cupin domain-containing protein n=1 Tax=Dankookia rubra TaxID=1442381 RepID=A0A4V3A9B4_9PROT|nr:cupin domain-containing protein [Dankookia rubra]TDH58595.1 cupin domain-containing protein [Dankookia rubra]